MMNSETVKKKILIRIGSLRHGGAEKVLVTFLKNLPSDKYEIDLLLNLYSGKYLADVPAWVKVFHLNKGEMITTNRLQDLPKKALRVIYQKTLTAFPFLLYQFILKGKKYDVEFAAIHGFRDEILNSPQKSSKKMIWIHNDLRKTEFHNYNDDEIRKFFGFDKILVISEHIQKDFENLAKNEDEKKRIVRIYNPLDTEEILSKSKEQNKENREEKTLSDHPKRLNDDFKSLSNEPNRMNGEGKRLNNEPRTLNQQQCTISREPLFVSVGTVFPQKGFDRLLRTHQKLLEEGFKHHILIIGDGYDFENVKNLRDDLGVSTTVTMLGFCGNPYPYIKKADFYILSSRYEGFPTVLFEALTLKKNIIATDVSGVREMLEDGELGLIVENSEEGIYEGMKKALQKTVDFNRYQENLLDYKMPFNLENSVQTLIKIIDDL